MRIMAPLYYGSSDACVGRFISYFNYSTAIEFCHTKGAVLMSVQTNDRLEILRAVGGSFDFWVGLEDREVEGRYVWQGDGTVMTEEQRGLLPQSPKGVL